MNYIVSGDEPFLKRKRVEALCAGRPVDHIYGTSAVKLINRLADVPLFDQDNDVIVVWDANKVKNANKHAAELATAVQDKDFGVLVLVTTGKLGKTDWVRGVEGAEVFTHNKLKDYEDANDVIRWIESTAASRKYRMNTAAAEFMFQRVGNSLSVLWKELTKLFIYCPNQVITVDDVAIVVSPSRAYKSYDIAIAALKQDKNLWDLFDSLYRTESHDPSIGIVSSMLSYVEKLIAIKSMIAANVSGPELSAGISVHPYIYTKVYRPLVGRLGVPKLVFLFQRLIDLDRELKSTTTVNNRATVERFLLTLA